MGSICSHVSPDKSEARGTAVASIMRAFHPNPSSHGKHSRSTNIPEAAYVPACGGSCPMGGSQGVEDPGPMWSKGQDHVAGQAASATPRKQISKGKTRMHGQGALLKSKVPSQALFNLLSFLIAKHHKQCQ